MKRQAKDQKNILKMYPTDDLYPENIKISHKSIKIRKTQFLK